MKISTAISIGAAAALAGAYAFIVRPRFLWWGSTPQERQNIWPGDHLAPDGRATCMRAVTIDAPPARVWPWIVQIGQDRAGFYSYQQLENAVGARMPKIERLVPEFGHRFVGDTLWLSDPRTFRGRGKLIVGYLAEERAMILVTSEDWDRVLLGKPIESATWGFILEPTPNGKTRLIMRSVTRAPAFSRQLLAGYTWELAHFIMERRMMLRIKELVEEAVDRPISLEKVEIAVEPA